MTQSIRTDTLRRDVAYSSTVYSARTEVYMVAYLETTLEEGEPTLVAAALGDIARAKGMTQIAREAGLGLQLHAAPARPKAAHSYCPAQLSAGGRGRGPNQATLPCAGQDDCHGRCSTGLSDPRDLTARATICTLLMYILASRAGHAANHRH